LGRQRKRENVVGAGISHLERREEQKRIAKSIARGGEDWGGPPGKVKQGGKEGVGSWKCPYIEAMGAKGGKGGRLFIGTHY